jgi:hypothetical protein
VLDLLRDPDLWPLLTVTGWIEFAIWLVLLAAKAVAFFYALRHTAPQYVSAGKQTRVIWLVITGLSLAFHLISGPLNFLNVAGTVGSLVFLLDVRPALRQVSGRGGSSSSGPYGGW